MLFNRLTNKFSMYRLAVMYLANLIVLAALFSVFGFLPYGFVEVVGAALFLVLTCFGFNWLFASIVKVKANHESAFITALILALIFGPLSVINNWPTLLFLAVTAMLSKYLLTLRGKHIFNPAALAAVLAAVFLGQGASWWVGSLVLLPFVLIMGWPLLRKISREIMALVFLSSYFILMMAFNFTQFSGLASLGSFVWQLLLYSPLIFFALVMLPEPQTSPRRKKGQMLYAVFVALAMVLMQTYWSVAYTMEAALLVGNVFAFLIAPQFRWNLNLKQKIEVVDNIFEFRFEALKPLTFRAGQYLEWTLYHKRADSRGIRRYFTVASSPTEEDVILAAKFYDNPSTFKQNLLQFQPGEGISVTGPSGDFVLPKNKKQKLVFIAGGIGITPFRSMTKFLVDKNDKRDVMLFYAAKTSDEFAFTELFELAKEKIGLRTVYVADQGGGEGSAQESGHIDNVLIKKYVSDWQERIFYVSGPQLMVKAMERILKDMGVSVNRIKKDYFPGYEEI